MNQNSLNDEGCWRNVGGNSYSFWLKPFISWNRRNRQRYLRNGQLFRLISRFIIMFSLLASQKNDEDGIRFVSLARHVAFGRNATFVVRGITVRWLHLYPLGHNWAVLNWGENIETVSNRTRVTWGNILHVNQGLGRPFGPSLGLSKIIFTFLAISIKDHALTGLVVRLSNSFRLITAIIWIKNCLLFFRIIRRLCENAFYFFQWIS